MNMEEEQDKQQQQQEQTEEEHAAETEIKSESESAQEKTDPDPQGGDNSTEPSEPLDTEIVPLEEDVPVTTETAQTIEGAPEVKEEEKEPYVKMDGDPLLVLVTGASGFIATHIVQQLQEEGYRVRATVRSLDNEEKVQHIRELCPEAKYPVELVEADLNNSDCWSSAIKDCTYVIHVASPFPAENPKDENEIIRPAVEGTTSLLKACHDARTVKRVVLTSSVAAIAGTFSSEQNKIFTEDDWTDLTKVDPYPKSKTLAEKAAWDYVQGLPEEERFGLAVINPAYVMGPVLNNSNFTSMVIPKRLLERSMPAIPKLNFPIVDVRDVARAHIRAMTLPEAEGKRFVLSHTNMWLKEIAQQVSKEFKSQGYNVPTTNCPYLFLWAASIFDKTIKMVLPSVGKVAKFDNTRMKEVLGIEPLELKDTILDMCYSMIEKGMVKKTKKYRGRAPLGEDAPEQTEEGATDENHKEAKLNGGVVDGSKVEGQTEVEGQPEGQGVGEVQTEHNGGVVAAPAASEDEKVDEDKKVGEGQVEVKGESQEEVKSECQEEVKDEGDIEVKGEGEMEVKGEGEMEVKDEGDMEVRGQGEGQEADANAPVDETEIVQDEVKGVSVEEHQQTAEIAANEE
ncbi:NADPH-dependent aldehyde reductase ARI1-like isoform X2 [Lingula anatina]|uniref:NADPH-dependent aldehyde reductase ARI1-like isoform X2 n=1 Tax=Lingula anatina TaxID=7574 RepID=A0A2R2MIQ1_LINAN|nr:NADPH-dependent aldehyde reductase ARI1-like isoform X2 [Lingula anatina]|eukprot:XP_023930106.1 NADPH-dependent aldehyde reductase ARI1-like isoform X2 [Lingula anatina]